jgi:hypothetical protein
MGYDNLWEEKSFVKIISSVHSMEWFFRNWLVTANFTTWLTSITREEVIVH